MLSDASILSFMRSSDIVVKPFSEMDLRPAGLTLHLGDTLLFPPVGATVNLVSGKAPAYQKKILGDHDTYTLSPGAFVIAQTFERVGISERIGMLIDGRSTLGRLGLAVHATSAIFDTGEEPKFVTLELKNVGPMNIVVGSRFPIVRAVFFLLKPSARRRYDSYGRYGANDSGLPVL